MTWRRSGFDGMRMTRGGWTFFIAGSVARFQEPFRQRLIDSAFAAIDGALATHIRRSRHAETWFEHFDHIGGPNAYFKVLDPIRGLNRIRWIFKRTRAAHVASISEQLSADAIGVPEILLLGAERRGGREIIVTARVDGSNLARYSEGCEARFQARRVACARRADRAIASRRIHPRRPDAVQHLRHRTQAAAIRFHRS